jgi:hypothetical protein
MLVNLTAILFYVRRSKLKVHFKPPFELLIPYLKYFLFWFEIAAVSFHVHDEKAKFDSAYSAFVHSLIPHLLRTRRDSFSVISEGAEINLNIQIFFHNF